MRELHVDQRTRAAAHVPVERVARLQCVASDVRRLEATEAHVRLAQVEVFAPAGPRAVLDAYLERRARAH